jgi:hypothetical protein
MKRLTTMLMTLFLVALASGQSLPPGVTLQEIDGGRNYYSSHGFTYAHTAGWDDSTFFPIGPWLAPILSQADATRWLDLGLNTAFGLTANSNVALMRTNGLWLVAQMETPLTNQCGSETVGLIAADEADPWPAVRTTPNALQDHRFWWTNQTWNFIEYGDIGGVPAGKVLDTMLTTPNGTKRHLDLQSTDIYWFASVNTSQGSSQLNYYAGGLIYNLGRNMVADEVRRGGHYGSMVDKIRPYQVGHYPAPIGQIVENGGPYGEDATVASYATPPELNWGVWSSIIHGARFIVYFNHSFGGPAQSQDNFANNYYKTIQSGQTISMYNQAKATNALVKQLAPVLNSQTALGYVTVSPAAATFSGIEVMAKSSRGQFYIFADTRVSQTATNISATFTIKNTGAASVTVVNESRTIPITNGGTTFTDVFASASTVHIYQTSGGSGISRTPSVPSGRMATRLQLGSNPWPANSPLAINVALGSKTFTRLAIHDLRGELVHSIAAQTLLAGEYVFFWDGWNDKSEKVSGGLYVVKLTAEKVTMAKPVVVE